MAVQVGHGACGSFNWLCHGEYKVKNKNDQSDNLHSNIIKIIFIIIISNVCYHFHKLFIHSNIIIL